MIKHVRSQLPCGNNTIAKNAAETLRRLGAPVSGPGLLQRISDANLLDIVKHLVRRQGYSSDYCHCRFSGDLDPEEASFDGVRFSFFDDTITITEGRSADCLERMSESYGQAHPAKAHRMTELVLSFRQSM